MATASHVNEKQMSREMVEVDKASLHKMILTSTVLYMTIFSAAKEYRSISSFFTFTVALTFVLGSKATRINQAF